METTVQRKRGRQKGQTLDRCYIRDEQIHPYYIKITDTSFDVMKEGDVMAVGYFGNLVSALQKIATLKTNSRREKFSLSDYIKEYRSISEAITNLGC